MPLVEIRFKRSTSLREMLVALRKNLPAVAAEALSCPEGGNLEPKDIMIEFGDATPDDKNCKDVHVRVWAHDYPSRRDNLTFIRRKIENEVIKHLPPGTSWYVWVLLAITSYGSDTQDN
jgi:hypothetical protein